MSELVDSRQDVRLTLPFPPKELSPNSRVHWRGKAVFAARYREECGWAGMDAAFGKQEGRWYTVRRGEPLTPPVEADVTFVVKDRRRRDEQNFLQMLKPAFDGLVDAGVLVDDNHEVFKVASCSFEIGEPKVIVVLRSGPQEGDG